MHVASGRTEMRRLADQARCEGKRLALVPTMGALHEGHLALVRAAKAKADHVTVSIFVNPTQFGPNEDFDRYPRNLDADLAALETEGGVDVVFSPETSELAPADAVTWVLTTGLDHELCGRFRPIHFRGVTTIVAKLYIACNPHVAVFGLKDAQQYLILRRMTRDLGFDVDVLGIPTVREADGLAMSSRNKYLNVDERKQAYVLHEALEAAAAAIRRGEQRPEAIVEIIRFGVARAPLGRIQYVQVVDTESIQPVETIRPGQEVLAALAVYFGQTRLIDNTIVRAPAPTGSASDLAGSEKTEEE